MGWFEKYSTACFYSFIGRTKYHSGWNLMEITLIISGITYGKNDQGKERWDFISLHNSNVEIPNYTF